MAIADELLAKIAAQGGPTLNTNAPSVDVPSTNSAPSRSITDELSAWVSSNQSQVNAPPSGVSATPQMNRQALEGRTDLQGEQIPIDIESGIPIGDYFHIGFQSDPEAKADALQKLYPDKKVRILDSGDVSIEVTDTKGKAKDVVINPRGVGVEDLIDLSVQTPEIAAQLATFLATKGRGTLRTIASMVLSAFAGGFAGKTKDIAARATGGIPIRPEDIQSQRNTETAMNIAAEGVLGAAGKATRALSPFARVAEGEGATLAFNHERGRQFLKENFNVEYPTTPGMRTGSPALQAIEAAEAPMPGARTVFNRMRSQKNQVVKDLQGIALGKVETDEAIGKYAENQIFLNKVEPLERAVEQARTKAIASGDKRVTSLIDDVIGNPGVTLTEAGGVVQESRNRALTRAKTLVDKVYADVRAQPGGTGDILDGTAAANAAQAIRKELPKALKEVEEETGLVSASGDPLTQTVTKATTLKTGVPEGLIAALDDLDKLRGAKVSLDTLTTMKNSAYDAIAAFRQAHPDRKDKWFTMLADAYEGGIQSGIDATENIELKNALLNARKTYKKEMVPLEKVGIRELGKDAFDPGRLSRESITTRLFEGPNALENYETLEKVLGPNNVGLRAAKRAWVDQKLADAADPILDTIDPDKLSASIKSAFSGKQELAKKVFGNNYEPILNALKIRKAIGMGGKIEKDELSALMSIKDPTVNDLKAVLDMTALRDTAYVNGIFRDIADGALDPSKLNWTQFVERLRNTKVPTEHVEEALKNLDKPTRDSIATAELYRLLNEASVSEGMTASQKVRGGPVNISPTKLAQAVGTGPQRDRTLLLLAEDLPVPGTTAPPVLGTVTNRRKLVENLVDTIAPNEAGRTVFNAEGNLASTMAMHQIVRGGALSYMTTYAKNAVLALAYRGKLGQLITNKQFDAEASAIAMNTMIGSEPFLKLGVETFGPEAMKEIVSDSKRSINKFMHQFFDSPEGRRKRAGQQFMQGQNVPMRMQAQP